MNKLRAKSSFDSKCFIRLVHAVLCEMLEPRGVRLKNTQAPSPANGANAEVLAQFHAAEYASERNSVDVWKTLQYALVPITFVAWSLLTQIRASLPPVVFWWACAAVLPLCYIAYQKAMVDALTGVLLIEERVRPLAIQLAGTDEFWFHEPIYRRDVKPDAPYGWYWPPLLSFASPLAVLAYRAFIDHCFSNSHWWQHLAGYGDLAGYGVCCLAAWLVGDLSKQGRSLNRQIGEKIRQHQFGWLREG
jgi:hypothetical protein